MYYSVKVAHGELTVAPLQQWSIKISPLCRLRDQESGRHAQRSSAHISYHHVQTELARLAYHGQSFGQAATLVEFDVDRLVPVNQSNK